MAEVHLPADLDEAVATLAEFGADATAVAGGTDVLLDQRLGRIRPAHLVDLSRAPQLCGLEADGDRLRVGAMTRLATLVGDRRVRERFPALAEAALGVGTPLVRNMATLGGNVCQAAAHGEISPALLAHDAVLTVASPDGTREVSTSDLVVGTRRTSLVPGEVLTAATLDAPDGWGAAYVPFDPAGVGVAVGLRVAGGRVDEARVALCWTVPVPRRAPAAEVALAGATGPDDDVLESLAAAVRGDCDPLADAVYGPVAHRRQVAGVVAARAARIAWRRAAGTWPARVLSPPAGRLEEAVA